MNNFVTALMLLGACLLSGVTHAAPISYADGDLAPLGVPNSLIDYSDYLIATRIVAGGLAPTELEMSHGDIYPTGSPDGVINLQDLLLLQQRIGDGTAHYVENLSLFVEGPATVGGESGGNTAYTTVVVGGYTGPGAVVTNDPNLIDPEDSANTIWHVAVSGGVANASLGTADLSSDSVLDTGFDLSGDGTGQLVFDIKVNSLSGGAVLTVKMDSGDPDLGQVQLSGLTIGSWQRIAIDFADLLANPGAGAGLDLANVVNIFVIEVTGGSADVYLDNIFVTHSCADVGGCNATIKTKASGGPDTDSDGVPDSIDQCPATPTGTPVDATGCAIVIPLLSATATASTTGAAGGPSLAVDGDLETRWESAFATDPSWLTLDLGDSYSLSEVIIHWEAANAATYQIQGFDEAAGDWTTLSSQSGGTFGDRTDNVNVSGTYQYVRMNGLTRTSPYGYSIWEMEVYGLPAADEDGDGVNDSLDLCPGTPAGSAVDATGCVIVDTDGDGVPDGSDLCPGTPAGSVVGPSGCVIVIPVNEVVSINDILAGGFGTSQPGFTLYVFDDDLAAPGTSTCYDGCAANWPPLLVSDGVSSGVSDLGTIARTDGTTQVTHNGRPLYFYVGDAVAGDTNGDGASGVWHKVAYVHTYTPLFNNTTVLEPDTQFETNDALVTRFSDRPRTRHAREDQFQAYDHYIKFYFEDRSSNIEIVDYVAKGGDTIVMNVRTIFPLSNTEAENRWWYEGITTVAQYASNGIMSYEGFDGVYYHYQKTSNENTRLNREIRLGDRMEFEISQFSAPGIPRGQPNYYGTTFLYIVGEGIVPWYAEAPPSTFPEDSHKIPEEYWLGGHTSMHYQYTDEPNDHFMQMATNLGYDNGQTFLLGRRVHHSSFVDGTHDEDPANGVLSTNAGLAGTRYINQRCSDCHERNGGAPVAANGELLDRWVFKVGDANGAPDPNRGRVLQPNGSAGEGSVSIASWTELANGLRTPNYQFSGGVPAKFSARIAPRLVGLGLLEAIVEADIEALADPADSNGDGISGRINFVTDAATGQSRIGRFGWKAGQPAVKQQAASALNTDLGVRTSVLPYPDCGSAQTNCGESSPLMPDENLDNLVLYLSTLGVRPQRVWKAGVEDQQVLAGRDSFRNIGCTGCHTETFQTSEYHPLAEVRDQTIHPYSDMLLHDMGPGLADSLGEGLASGSEWRTTPLWGIGLAACVTGGVTNPSGMEGGEICTPHHAYLHDGRARTIDEAIRWHGGEGETSKQAYEALTQTEKDALIAFLKSL